MATQKDHMRILIQSADRINLFVTEPFEEESWDKFDVPKNREAVMFNFQRAVDKVEKLRPILNQYCLGHWDEFPSMPEKKDINSPYEIDKKNLWVDSIELSCKRKLFRETLLAMPYEQSIGDSTREGNRKALKFAFQLNNDARCRLNLGTKEILRNDAIRLGSISAKLQNIEERLLDLSKKGDDRQTTCDSLMYNIRVIASHTKRLSPLIKDRFPAFKATRMLEFEEEKMSESVETISDYEVIKAAKEYAPELGITVKLAKEQLKDPTRLIVQSHSFPSFFRLHKEQKKEKAEESFQTKSLHLID